jgi:Fic family protein
MFKNDFVYHSGAIEGLVFIMDDVNCENNEQKKFNHNLYISECFDFVLQTYSEKISEKYINSLHTILLEKKVIENIVQFDRYRIDEITINERKKPNNEKIREMMNELITKYHKEKMSLIDIARFHCQFERIHPFPHGSGSVARLIMLKQCLQNNVKPFVIEDTNKVFYRNGFVFYDTTDKPDGMKRYLKNQQMKFISKYKAMYYKLFKEECGKEY